MCRIHVQNTFIKKYGNDGLKFNFMLEVYKLYHKLNQRKYQIKQHVNQPGTRQNHILYTFTIGYHPVCYLYVDLIQYYILIPPHDLIASQIILSSCVIATSIALLSCYTPFYISTILFTDDLHTRALNAMLALLTKL